MIFIEIFIRRRKMKRWIWVALMSLQLTLSYLPPLPRLKRWEDNCEKGVTRESPFLFLHQVEKLNLANTELTGEQVSYLCDELKGLKSIMSNYCEIFDKMPDINPDISLKPSDWISFKTTLIGVPLKQLHLGGNSLIEVPEYTKLSLISGTCLLWDTLHEMNIVRGKTEACTNWTKNSKKTAFFKTNFRLMWNWKLQVQPIQLADTLIGMAEVNLQEVEVIVGSAKNIRHTHEVYV